MAPFGQTGVTLQRQAALVSTLIAASNGAALASMSMNPFCSYLLLQTVDLIRSPHLESNYQPRLGVVG